MFNINTFFKQNDDETKEKYHSEYIARYNVKSSRQNHMKCSTDCKEKWYLDPQSERVNHLTPDSD